MRCAAIVPLIALAVTARAQEPWQPAEFPIGCWGGPPVAFNTLEAYRTVSECNFTLVGPTGGYTVEANQQMLALCEQVGLKALVADGRISTEMTDQDNWRELLAQVVADYADRPALYGYYLRDEPNYLQFAALGEINRELSNLDPAHLPFINLFPTYANVKQLGTPTYADHLDQFVRIVHPRVVCYDHYALLKTGGIRPDYYENMELVRDRSLASGIPWWYVHYSGAWAGYREPTEAEMRWQVYTSLAYGVRGIMYWYYWGRPQEGDGRTGVVDAEGKPTRLYGILQKLNAETRIIGGQLVGLQSTGVYFVGEIPPGTRRLGTDAVVKLPNDLPLMVGMFEDAEGQTYAMVVNRDYQNPVEFEATFLAHVVGVERISPEDGGASDAGLQGGKLPLQLAAGDGALLRLNTHFEYPEPPAVLTEINFQFDRDNDLEGWGGFQSLTSPTVRDGVLTMGVGPGDPHFARTRLRIAPDTCRALRLRMRLTSGQPTAQVFWTTSDEPAFADTKYMNFPIAPDGEWHEYEVAVGEHERWRGKEIRALRLDPTTGGSEPGAQVQIDWIVGVPAQ